MNCFCCIVKILKGSHENETKIIQKSYILLSKQNKVEVAAKDRKRYFHIDKSTSSEQIYALLDDVDSADEDVKDNLMNDSDTEFIAK